ncbi:MAG: RnfABCDGE type electron transport complex subunit D [Methylophilaceae bacterium]
MRVQLQNHIIKPLSLLSFLWRPVGLKMGWLNKLDARYFQLIFLVSLLIFGALARDFSLSCWQVLLTFASAAGTQAFWQFYLQLPNRKNLQGYLSAFVTTCSIAILVRSDVVWVHPALACIAMSSKFLIRFGNGSHKGHIFNPANLAAFSAYAWMPHAWLSSGQWGQETLSALWMLILGATVAGRVARWDVSFAFIIAWLGLLAARLLWLGYATDLATDMWLHQAMNGATILFTFFMISDPMTTPQHRTARIIYAMLVAGTAFAWQYGLYKPQGLMVALFIWSLSVPLWNRTFQNKRFSWQ